MREWPLQRGHVSYNRIYDEVQARIWAGETTASYAALSELEQALIFEAYVSARLITAIEADEHAKVVKHAHKQSKK